ncbi:S-layer homology domain-containing protein [Paenibacillus sp. PL2-23]|uniref:S-layer homology domain-containing protein n=1 Tax=Paenibacillus sp. PL2-23 TaxID=2100729 RepID=UPI0030FBF9C5
MLQMKRNVIAAMSGIVLTLAVLMNMGIKGVDASERATIVKTFELANPIELLTLTVEGYDGLFRSRLMLPDGHVIHGPESTRIQYEDEARWSTVYSVSRAAKGLYTITIDAPIQAFYNLIVDVPLFSDIAGHWAREVISDYVSRGIVNGYGDGRFGPEDAVTGEALIKMMVLALTEEQPNGLFIWSKPFRWRMQDEELSLQMGWKEYDFLSKTSKPWSASYLSAAADLGITKDWDEGQMKASFKRKDVALLIGNMMSLLVMDTSKTVHFTDTSTLSKKYLDAISLISSQSIITGYPDKTFRPEAPVTRAETIKMIARLEGFLK